VVGSQTAVGAKERGRGGGKKKRGGTRGMLTETRNGAIGKGGEKKVYAGESLKNQLLEAKNMKEDGAWKDRNKRRLSNRRQRRGWGEKTSAPCKTGSRGT